MLVSTFNYLRVRLACKKGQGMVEYGLIIGLIAILVIGAVALFKDELVKLFENITGVISDTNKDIKPAAPAGT